MNKTNILFLIVLFVISNLVIFWFDDNYSFDGFNIVKNPTKKND